MVGYAHLLHKHFKDYDGALDTYEEALVIDPNCGDALYGRACILMDHMDDPQEALDSFHKYLKNPTSPKYTSSARKRITKLQEL